MARYLSCGELVLFVIALALLAYSWGDKPARRRYSAAAYVAFGVAFGLQALAYYLTHSPSWLVWSTAVPAVVFPSPGSGRGKASSARTDDEKHSVGQQATAGVRK
ncbi:hypothetical protein [Mycobacterium sp.]|uniref:hypothetical protein n=1 Tax=Mycobacterium sp. TaxID=1785 RepID=UPI003F97A12F